MDRTQIFIAVVAQAVALGITANYVKNRSAVLWFVLGVCLPLISWIFLATRSDLNERDSQTFAEKPD